MNKQRSLLLGRNIFILIIFIALGSIVLNEKSKEFLLPKAEEKLTGYLKDNFSKLDGEVETTKVVYKNEKFQMKVVNKKNNNLYFYTYYSNKKYSNTYKKDYKEGNSLFTKIKKDLKKEISDNINTKVDIDIPNTLDKYTTIVRKRIIEEDNLSELKFYNIKKELVITNWNAKDISIEINNFIKLCNSKGYSPKNYIITITNESDITNSILIEGLDEEYLNSSNQETIISDIMNKKNLEQSKINYRYLN